MIKDYLARGDEIKGSLAALSCLKFKNLMSKNKISGDSLKNRILIKAKLSPLIPSGR